MSERIDARKREAIDASVSWFGNEMTTVLLDPKNLAKDPWDYCSDVYLINSLTKSLIDVQENTKQVATKDMLAARIKECADVANIAMFIASNAHHLLSELEEEEASL